MGMMEGNVGKKKKAYLKGLGIGAVRGFGGDAVINQA